MIYDLEPFEFYVKQGYIRKVEQGPLVLYNYTDKCTYDRAWNMYTMAARGIIFEKATGKLIAKPFPKFFNLGEMPETQLLNLPSERYEAHEKMDGSLGIIYYYDGKWNVATRGSFSSEQAEVAKELLSKYDTKWLNKEQTYLVEIIYPENKIVVNYEGLEELVLLAVFEGEVELRPSEMLCKLTGLKAAPKHNHSIEEMIALQQTMPKDQEGFVVRFESGLRVKIKGAEYLKIHKMISNMSPLSFWESMEVGVVKRDYLAQLPEEYRIDYEPIVEELERQYSHVTTEILKEFAALPLGITPKELGLLTQGPNNLLHPGAMFAVYLNKPEVLNKYIMKHIRPDANSLKSMQYGYPHTA